MERRKLQKVMMESKLDEKKKKKGRYLPVLM